MTSPAFVLGATTSVAFALLTLRGATAKSAALFPEASYTSGSEYPIVPHPSRHHRAHMGIQNDPSPRSSARQSFRRAHASAPRPTTSHGSVRRAVTLQVLASGSS